ncbi:MAG: hypothetical protein RLZZ172_1552, partial [Bacteroidota bacterium]
EPGYPEMKNFMQAIKAKATDPIDFETLRSALQADPEHLKRTLIFMKGEGIIGIDVFGRISLK